MHGFGSWDGCSLATLPWVSVNSGSMASSRLWRHVYIWSELPQEEKHASCKLANRTGVISCEAPLLVVSRGVKEVVGGAKEEGQGDGCLRNQGRP